MEKPTEPTPEQLASVEAGLAEGADWRLYAACKGTDPELFFSVGNTMPARQARREAKAICVSCFVRSQCLEWALNEGEEDGVWGGTDENERRAILRRRASARTRYGNGI